MSDIKITGTGRLSPRWVVFSLVDTGRAVYVDANAVVAVEGEGAEAVVLRVSGAASIRVRGLITDVVDRLEAAQ